LTVTHDRPAGQARRHPARRPRRPARNAILIVPWVWGYTPAPLRGRMRSPGPIVHSRARLRYMKHPFRAAAVAALAVAFGVPPASSRAETKPVGWSANVNLGAVLTEGNTETVSATLKARVERNWLRTLFYFDGSGMRQDATDDTSFGIGPAAF